MRPVGLAFLLNLLGVLPGTVIYHLLIFLTLLPAAGIIWIEWRNTRSVELRPYVFAVGGTMVTHLLSLACASFQVVADSNLAVVTAPFLYAQNLLSILLLFCAFGTGIWKALGGKWLRKIGFGSPSGAGNASGVMGVAIAGWLVLWAAMTALWLIRALPNALNYQTHTWQVPGWYLLSAVAAFASVGLIMRYSRRTATLGVVAAFVIFGVASLAGLFGAAILGSPLTNGEGLGRFLMLLGYPLFTIALYEASLKDLQSYRQELRALSQDALRQSQELLFLIEATRSIGTAFDVRDMLSQVAENIAMALGADRVAIFLCDIAQSDELRLVTQYEVLSGERMTSHSLTLKDHPRLRAALLERRSVFSQYMDVEIAGASGVASSMRAFQPLLDVLGAERKGPVLIQPLVRQNELMGVLLACNDHSGRPFSEERERLATTIAVQIASAVENSRLYRDIEAKAEELHLLLRIRDAELERQDAIFESVAEGILVSDADGYVILINAAAKEILGFAPDDSVQERLSELLAKLSPGGETELEDLIGLDEPLETVFHLNNQIIRVHAAPVRMGKGESSGMVAILQDVTREHLAEESKRDFITSISHELRTPLTAIRGYVEVMLAGMGGELSPMVMQFLRVIQDNTLRMSYLTDNIISVAEIDRGRIGLSYQTLDVLKLLEDTVSRYQERVTERQLVLEQDFAVDMPKVRGDSHRLRLVLDNLMDNAIKFTYPGGRIELGCSAIQGHVEGIRMVTVWVTDTGVGIPAEAQPRIWERFYRVDNPLSLEAGGLGIGLTITKALVEAHGGRIWVDSTPGEGSTFTVLLPTRRSHNIDAVLDKVIL
jgi:PAS domain S-box-containing protein